LIFSVLCNGVTRIGKKKILLIFSDSHGQG
jgi:hypothetical protein